MNKWNSVKPLIEETSIWIGYEKWKDKYMIRAVGAWMRDWLTECIHNEMLRRYN